MKKYKSFSYNTKNPYIPFAKELKTDRQQLFSSSIRIAHKKHQLEVCRVGLKFEMER